MTNETPSVAVAANADMPAIAAAAGNAAMDARWYAKGRLYVRGVTQAALEAALTPERVSPPDPVPASVTNFQARALMRSVILGDGRSLETAVREMLWSGKSAAAALPEADPARIAADTNWLAWEQSNEFQRAGALVSAIGAQLGYSEAELDEMFRQAAQIQA